MAAVSNGVWPARQLFACDAPVIVIDVANAAQLGPFGRQHSAHYLVAAHPAAHHGHAQADYWPRPPAPTKRPTKSWPSKPTRNCDD